jgi:hypothetical protein
MTSALFMIFWVLLFATFALSARAYFLFLLFFVFVGGWDIVAGLPRVFGLVFASNLMSLQICLGSIFLVGSRILVVKEVVSRMARVVRWLVVLLACLFAVNIPAGLTDPSSVFFGLLNFLNIILAFFCAPLVFRKIEDWYRAAEVVAIAVMVNLIPSTLQMVSGRTFMEFYYLTVRSSFDSSVDLPLVAEGIFRIRGFFYSHASFAFALMTAVSFFLAFLLPHARKNAPRLWLIGLGLGAGLIQLYFTFMRGAWLNAGLVISLVLILTSRRKAATAIALGVILGALILLPTTTARFQSLDSYDEGTDATNGRLVLWARLLPFDTGSPILGNGLGSYSRVADTALDGDIIPSHSDYVLMLLECGWFTAVVLLLVFSAVAVQSFGMFRGGGANFYAGLALVGSAILLAQVLQGFFENLMGQSWKFLPALILGVAFYRFRPLPIAGRTR